MKTVRILALAALAAAAVLCAETTAQSPGPAAQPAPVVIERAPHGPAGAFVTYGFVPGDQSQSGRIARDLAKAEKEDQKKELRKKLAEILGKQFDQHLQQQQKELADLERQIADLRALLKKRSEARDSIIDNRIDQLVREAQGLGWTTPGGPGGPRMLYPPGYGAVRAPSVFGPRPAPPGLVPAPK